MVIPPPGTVKLPVNFIRRTACDVWRRRGAAAGPEKVNNHAFFPSTFAARESPSSGCWKKTPENVCGCGEGAGSGRAAPSPSTAAICPAWAVFQVARGARAGCPYEHAINERLRAERMRALLRSPCMGDRPARLTFVSADGSGSPGRHAQAALGRATRGPRIYFATSSPCTSPARPGRRDGIFALDVATKGALKYAVFLPES